MVRCLDASDALHVPQLEQEDVVLAGCQEKGVIHLEPDDFRVELDVEDGTATLGVKNY